MVRRRFWSAVSDEVDDEVADEDIGMKSGADVTVTAAASSSSSPHAAAIHTIAGMR